MFLIPLGCPIESKFLWFCCACVGGFPEKHFSRAILIEFVHSNLLKCFSTSRYLNTFNFIKKRKNRKRIASLTGKTIIDFVSSSIDLYSTAEMKIKTDSFAWFGTTNGKLYARACVCVCMLCANLIGFLLN